MMLVEKAILSSAEKDRLGEPMAKRSKPFNWTEMNKLVSLSDNQSSKSDSPVDLFRNLPQSTTFAKAFAASQRQQQEEPKERSKSPLEVDDSLFITLLLGLKDNKRIFSDVEKEVPEVKRTPTIEVMYPLPPIQLPPSNIQITPFSPAPTTTQQPVVNQINAPTQQPISQVIQNSSSITSSITLPPSIMKSNHQTDRTRDVRWKEHFSELMAFRKEYGHTNVTQTKSKTLAEWVKNQRRLRKAGKLSQSRIDKLDEIGFEWDRSYLFKNKRTDEVDSQVSPRKRKLRYSSSDIDSDDSSD